MAEGYKQFGEVPIERRSLNEIRRDEGIRNPAREGGAIQRNLSNLSNTIDGLDEALSGLYMAIEPVIGPELSQRYPDQGEDDGGDDVQHVIGSEITERLDQLTRQLEAITRRVRTMQGRVEL